MEFDPLAESFTGKWGMNVETPTLQWDGKRCEATVSSAGEVSPGAG